MKIFLMAVVVAMLVDFSFASAGKARSIEEEHFQLSGAVNDLTLFVRHLPAEQTSNDTLAPVLYVHGATFPSGLSVAFKFDGKSWMDELSHAGFDVWAFDFAGYGHSERYEDKGDNLPEGRAIEAATQIKRVVHFIMQNTGAEKVSIIAHSWGTIPTGIFAVKHSQLIDRLVLFGPVAQRAEQAWAVEGSHHLLTIDQQYARFVSEVPEGETQVLSKDHFASWGQAYLSTDQRSGMRNPPSVEVPSGPRADVSAAWSGSLAYDPAKITVPVVIIRGEWDTVTTDDDARWLFNALKASPIKRDVKISRATHLMHLEENRHALYREVETFLRSKDQELRK